jgi:hypothetical protein
MAKFPLPWHVGDGVKTSKSCIYAANGACVATTIYANGGGDSMKQLAAHIVERVNPDQSYSNDGPPCPFCDQSALVTMKADGVPMAVFCWACKGELWRRP